MPCCAFAAFILSQVVLGFGALKRFVLRSDGAFDDAPSNSATEWRLIGGAPALAEPSRRRYGWRMLAIAASVEILIAIGAAYGYHLHVHHHHHNDLASIASAPVSVRIR
jgi:hypothetical protein